MSSKKLMITGMMGSGKGYTAAYLSDKYGAIRWTRTELMKQLSHAIIDHVGNSEAILKRIFDDPYAREQASKRLFLYGEKYQPEEGKPRRLYQEITEICQSFDPLCFETELEYRIENLGKENSFVLIDDVRSLAAFEYFAEAGYKSLRIDADESIRRERMLERDGYLPPEETFNHTSETELNNVEHNYVLINNTNSRHDLETKVDSIYKDFINDIS